MTAAELMKSMLPSGARARRAGLWLAFASWLLLNAILLWIYSHPTLKPLVGDEFDYNRRAIALLGGQPMPELFIWPPGQTWFVAAVYAVFGAHVFAVQIIQIMLLAACAAMLMRLWQTLDNRRAALCAASLFMLNPSALAYAHWLWPEVTYLACLLGALTLLLTFTSRAHSRAFFAGLLIGLALLFKSLIGGFWPFFLLFFLSRKNKRYSYAWLSALAFCAGLLLAVAPTLWKGHVATGHALIADSSLYNLDVGLRDSSRSDYVDEAGLPALTAFVESAPTPQQRNAVYLDKVKGVVAERGLFNVFVDQLDSQYFRLFNAKTLLVSQLPGPRCEGYLGAYGSNSVNGPLTFLSDVMHSLTLVLCAFGLALWRRWLHPFAAFCALYLAYQLALFLGLHVMERYFFQMQPLLCGFAGSFLAVLLRREASQDVLSFARWRWLVGGVVAIVLLGLAWLGPVFDGACQ